MVATAVAILDRVETKKTRMVTASLDLHIIRSQRWREVEPDVAGNVYGGPQGQLGADRRELFYFDPPTRRKSCSFTSGRQSVDDQISTEDGHFALVANGARRLLYLSHSHGLP
jgi:hypothetical protein